MRALVAALVWAALPGPAASAPPQFLWETTMRQRPSQGFALAVDRSGYAYAGGAWSDSRVTVLYKPFLRKYALDGTLLWTRTGASGGTTIYVESVRSLAVLPGGDVVAAGQVWSGAANKLDGWLSRWTASGSLVWSVTINGSASGEDAINGVAVTPAGDIVVAGSMESLARPGYPMFWVGNYKAADGAASGVPSLTASWTSYPDKALDVAVDSSGSVYVVGQIGDPVNGCTDGVIVKLTPSLSSFPDGWWLYITGAALSSSDYAGGVAIAPDGDILVSGGVTDAGVYEDAWFGKVAVGTGTVSWSVTVDGGEGDYDYGTGIAAGPDGSVFVAGALDTLYPLPGTSQDAWVGRYTAVGGESWRCLKDFNAHGNDIANRIAVYGGDVIAVGTLEDPANGPTFWLARVTDNPPVSRPDFKGVTPAPNPWRPGSGGLYDAPAQRFLNLPAGAHLRIYTLTGALVRDLEDGDGDGVIAWDGKNGGGSDAVSGVYIFAVVSKSGDVTRGKVVIVR